MTLGGPRQEVNDGSVALQAGRDLTINNHGLRIEDVRDLVDAFVRHQLPAMQEVAKKVAEERALKFCEEFVRQAAASQKVLGDEFVKPDAQATFQVGLSGVAIKGDDADLALVVAALVRRLEAADEPLIKQVLESAIAAMPKLSRAQIAFLAFVQYVKGVTHNSIVDISHLEAMMSSVMPAFEAGLNLSTANQQYLAGLGLLTINPVADAPIWFSSLRQQYPFIPPERGQLEAFGFSQLPQMLDAYETIKVAQVFLTITGSAIGLLQLRRVLGNLDLSIWIN